MKESNDKSALQLILSAVSLVCSLAVIVLACLQLFGVMKNAVFIYMPLMGVTMLVQTYNMQKQGQKKVAIFSLAVAIFLFIVTIIRLIML